MELKDITTGQIFVFCRGSPKQYKEVRNGYKHFMIKNNDTLFSINAPQSGSETGYTENGWRTLSGCKQCKWGLKAALMSCPLKHRFEAYNA